jgi:hypothetical protein
LLVVGCSGVVSRPPTLDYAVTRAQVELRFEGGPVEVVFSDAADPTERELARCQAACRIALPSGRYRLRTLGDAPEVERTFELHQHARIVVDAGNSVQRSAGIGLEVLGGAGSAVLLLGALAFSGRMGDDRDHGERAAAIIGLSGLAALTTGIVLHQAGRTRVRIQDIDDPLPSASGRDGVGFRF